MTELEILQKQIEALKELVSIKDQTIAELKAKPAQIQYVDRPYPYYVYQQPNYQYGYPYWYTSYQGAQGGGVNIQQGAIQGNYSQIISGGAIQGNQQAQQIGQGAAGQLCGATSAVGMGQNTFTSHSAGQVCLALAK